MKICTAPRYHSRLTLAERVQVLDAGGWRPATADLLATLCADDGDVAVMGLPRHLLKRWWRLAESSFTSNEFTAYALEVAQYFQYKQWQVPRINFLAEVLASDGAHDQPPVPSQPMRFAAGVGTLFACINLDDENAAIALAAESAQVRVILEPGEGLLLPPVGVRWNRSRVGSAELAVTMLIGSLATA